jgi:nitrite reductase/ring-hydroxylating ferredoxin subunit
MRLCALADLPEGRAVPFQVGEGDWPLRGLLVRRGDAVIAFENRCPHAGHRLDFPPGKFMTPDGTWLRCASHGALFRPEDGECVAGPCTGERLRIVATEIRDGMVTLLP